MPHFAFGPHLLIVLVEMAAFLLLVALGLAIDAYYSHRKLAPVHVPQPARPKALPTLAAWRRAAWRQADPRAAQSIRQHLPCPVLPV